jgi:hypothetical protein
MTLLELCEERLAISGTIPAGTVEYKFDEKRVMPIDDMIELSNRWGKCWNDSEKIARAALIMQRMLMDFAEFETVVSPAGSRWPIGVHAKSCLTEVEKIARGE